ncbi:MAG: DUF648 domain-containing protein [Chlamydiae bacterium]|nr:DUF648 domain-containing protein [Chlamydiota bacterium]
MNNIDFFTPVKFFNQTTSFEQSFIEGVDDYFYLGGSTATVVKTSSASRLEQAIVTDETSPLILTILKVASYCTVIIPLVMLVLKSILRSSHSYEKIDPQLRAENEIPISTEFIKKISTLIPEITRSQDDERIVWLSKAENLVFRLADDPNHVLKLVKPHHNFNSLSLPEGGENETRERFQNIVMAKQICANNNLAHLVIPQTSLFSAYYNNHEYAIIIEENLNFDPDETDQKCHHKTYESELTNAVKELATFIAKTGFNDVTWRNIPIIKEDEAYIGQRRIALIDLEHMQNVRNGFLGDGNGSCGLISCVSRKNMNIVIDEMKRNGIQLTSQETMPYITNARNEEFFNNRLHEYYTQRNMTKGNAPITVNIENLGLNLDELGEISIFEESTQEFVSRNISLREVAQEVIDEINRIIENNTSKATIRAKRLAHLHLSHDKFMRYRHLGLPREKIAPDTEEEEANLWINQICRALVNNYAVFEVKKARNGLLIQA